MYILKTYKRLVVEIYIYIGALQAFLVGNGAEADAVVLELQRVLGLLEGDGHRVAAVAAAPGNCDLIAVVE